MIGALARFDVAALRELGLRHCARAQELAQRATRARQEQGADVGRLHKRAARELRANKHVAGWHVEEMGLSRLARAEVGDHVAKLLNDQIRTHKPDELPTLPKGWGSRAGRARGLEGHEFRHHEAAPKGVEVWRGQQLARPRQLLAPTLGRPALGGAHAVERGHCTCIPWPLTSVIRAHGGIVCFGV